MKKLLFLLMPVMALSQERNIQVSFGIDPRNAIVGSAPTQNKPQADITAGIAIKTGNGGLQLGVNYQYFPSIGYYDLELEVGYILKYRERWLITPQMSSKLIMRGGEMVEDEINNNEFIGQKLSINVKYKVYKGLYLGFDYGVTFRGDKWEMQNQFGKSLVPDGTFEIVYIVEFN